jgi:hypothetical protein
MAQQPLQPWYMALFLVAWATAMVYVTLFTAMAVRIRHLTGEARGPDDWLNVLRDRKAVRYLRWVFKERYRTLHDPALDRLAPVVKALFLAGMALMLFVFGLIPWAVQR